jgi:predicted XRE-type DNA-binding protein
MPKQTLITTVHPNTETVYKAIEMATKLHNLRQEDLAKVLGVKQNTVSYHLKNHTFDQDQINALLDYFELEIKVCVKD